MTPDLLARWSTSTALVALALLTPTECAASPAIDSTSGIFKHGASITVSGTGFGTKPQAAPTAFETLESGGFLPYWSTTTGLTVSSNLQRTARSSKTAYHNFKSGTSNDVHHAYLTGSNSILSPTWFVSYWAYLDPNFDWQNGAYPNPPKFLSNVKIFRLWNPGSTRENFVMATAGWGNNVIATNENTGGPAHWGLSNYPTTHLAPGTWHHLQFAYKENSALGAADGQLLMWVDGRQVMNHTDYITRLMDDVLKRPFIVGFYNSWSPGEGTPDPSDVAPNEFYMDDVYVDTSCARVELGDKPVYSECTHRELQLPTTWSPASLVFTLNLGSFADNATAYLFIVDSDNAASPGYPVLLGSSPTDTTAPTVPTALAGTAASATTINLTWTASTDAVGVTGYRIFRDGTQVGTTATTTYTDTGLTPGTSYTYQVAAFDAAGNVSPSSSPASVLVHDETYTSFEDWVAGHFTAAEQANAAISGPSADPSGSGVPNLLRYAFNLPARGPVASQVSPAITGAGNDQRITLTFPRKGYAPDLEYVAQASTDLVTWTNLQTIQPGYPKTVTFTDSVATTSAPRRFLRLRVTTP